MAHQPHCNFVQEISPCIFHYRILLQLWQRQQWSPTWSRSPCLVQGLSIAWKALQKCPPFRRWHIGHDQALFTQAGSRGPGLVHTTRAEPPSHKLRNTRDWKHPHCFLYSPHLTDSIPNASLLRNATLASFPHTHLLTLWKRQQFPSSSSLSTGVWQEVSFAGKAFEKSYP